jgi:fluoride exporter
MQMKELLLVFIGGGLGSVVRLSLGKWVSAFHNHHFPLGTLVVNIVACFALGLIIGLADHKQIISPAARIFWTVGFCGGFSTFSTFSSETLYLLQNGFTVSLISYILISLLACVAATYGGLLLGESF